MTFPTLTVYTVPCLAGWIGFEMSTFKGAGTTGMKFFPWITIGFLSLAGI